MIEIEMITSDLKDLILICEDFLKYISFNLLEKKRKEIEFLEIYQKDILIKKLENLLKENFFVQIGYSDAIDILRKNSLLSNDTLINFSYTQEKFICDFFGNKPVFILNYPKNIKPFYMKNSINYFDKVDNFDLLLPTVGELVGGSIREDDYDILKKKMVDSGIKDMDWYLQLRSGKRRRVRY